MKKIISTFLTLFIFGYCVTAFASGEKAVVLVKLKDSGISYFNIDDSQKTELKKQAADEVFSEVKNTYGGSRRFTYTEIMTGFSMEIDKKDIEELKKNEYVEKVIILPRIIADNPNDSVNLESETCCDMINISYAHDAGYMGEGYLMAVIDASFDSDHEFFKEDVINPALSKANIENIIDAGSLNAVLSAEGLYKSTKLPFVYNYSLKNANTKSYDSHGTHVAGIIGGKNGKKGDIDLMGVAPESQLALMAVADEGGNIYADTVLAAMEDSIKIGADAVNISLGISYGEMIDIFDEAVSNMKKAGINVCAASGNDSRGYLNDVISPLNTDYAEFSSPASSKEVMSVANAVAPYSEMIVNTMASGDREFSYINGDVSFLSSFGGKSMEYVYCGLGTKEEITDDLTGKIALVDRGSITFSQKAQNAKDKGAVGIIIANSADSLLSFECGGILPSAMVTKTIGNYLKNNGDKIIDISDKEELVYSAQAGYTIKEDSGWATGMDLNLKPDISAPGTKILSSVNGGDYQLQSGTSMATPHYAGAYILVKEYLEDKNISCDKTLVNNIIMSSANVLRFEDTLIPYSPRNQGAGLVDVRAALNTKVILENQDGVSKLSLGENLGDEITLKIIARNITDEDAVFDDISLEVITDDVTDEGVIGSMRRLSFSADLPQEVTVKSNSEEEIEIKVTLDSNETKENLSVFKNGFYIDGYFIMKKSGTYERSQIAFTGYYGDWEKAPIVDLPWYESESFYSVTGLYSPVGDQCNTGEHDCYPLGVNSFAMSSEEDIDPMDYSGIEYAGYSPNADGVLDSLCITSFVMRPCFDYTVTIKDNAENEVYTNTLEVMEKYIFTCDDFSEELADGDYTAQISAIYASDGKSGYSLSMPFYTDTQKPSAEKVLIEEKDGRKLLTVDAMDNRFVMGIELIKDGEVIMQKATIPSGRAQAVFDITGLDEKTLDIQITDYAFNQFTLGAFPLECKTEKDLVFGDKSVIVPADFCNTSGEEIDADIFAVLYDRYGNMKDVSFKLSEKIAPLSSTKLFELKNPSLGDMVKIITLSAGKTDPICKYSQKEVTR